MSFDSDDTYHALIQQFGKAAAEQALRWAEQPQQAIITLASPHYPPQLKHIAHPPKVLFAAGDLGLLHQDQIAIVGSRQPTPTGAETAYAFAKELAKRGFVITSGMALGIDGASHRGALSEHGKTVAVLGAGLNRIYPPQHQQLARDIRQRGCLISPFALDMPPRRNHFPQRNRIISGLALGVLVAEAKLKSGSLITAQFALDQDREVFAIPSSIHNTMAKGCHYLLKQGACLVQCVDDITNELLNLTPSPAVGKQLHDDICCLDNDKQKLVKCVGYEATSVELIASRCQLPVQKITALCVECEMAGYLQSVPGGYIRNC